MRQASTPLPPPTGEEAGHSFQWCIRRGVRDARKAAARRARRRLLAIPAAIAIILTLAVGLTQTRRLADYADTRMACTSAIRRLDNAANNAKTAWKDAETAFATLNPNLDLDALSTLKEPDLPDGEPACSTSRDAERLQPTRETYPFDQECAVCHTPIPAGREHTHLSVGDHHPRTAELCDPCARRPPHLGRARLREGCGERGAEHCRKPPADRHLPARSRAA